MGAFIVDSIESDEPILVVVPARKIAKLRDHLGDVAERVLFADMDELGANPARIIPAWRDYVDDQSARSSQRFRGIGEPISVGRSPEQIVECQRHEALLNVAFGGAQPWWLVCPYDVSTLDAAVIDEAYRTHPDVITEDRTQASDTYRDIRSAALPFAAPLSEPRAPVVEFAVSVERLDVARMRVAEQAIAFGMDDFRVRDLVLAPSEVATNSFRYGGGTGLARLWTEGDTFFFEMRDRGRIEDALVGRVRPRPGQPCGYGLWLANQVCDLVQIRTFESGTVVRLVMKRI